MKGARPASADKPGRKTAGSAKRPRGTGATYVYDSLKAQILDLELKPGTLLDETVLGRQFGVSRSPVRESLIRLSAEGLVQNLRNRTSIVAQFDVSALPAYFDAMQLLYRLSARLAAGNRNPAKVRELERILAEHEAALRNDEMRTMVRMNREFHIAVAEMGGNPFIVSWMGGLLDQGQRILRLYALHLGDHIPVAALNAHRGMVDAIQRGDADAAEEAGRADAQALIDSFTESLADRPAGLLDLRAPPPPRRKATG